jgi:dipeptidyl-peptidase-4
MSELRFRAVLGALAGLAAAWLGAVMPALGQEGPRTVAEASEYRRTARYDDVQGFLKDLAVKAPGRVVLGSIGQSHEGREIPLLIVGDKPYTTPEQARGRMPVLLIGGIHSGECDGKEALLALGRDLAMAPDDDARAGVLKKLVLLIVPIYNPDGNERMAADNRPGQVGPEQMGVRENAQGLDLNRDFVKLEAPETRALVEVMTRWDPAVFVDTHTTNGSFHRYPLTFDGPRNPAGDEKLAGFIRGTLLPAVAAGVKQDRGLDTFWYGDFAKDHTRWETYPDLPRYSVPYLGLRNRIGVLTESYSYATYRQRVEAQEAFVGRVLREVAERTGEIRSLIAAADDRAQRVRPEDAMAITSSAQAAPERATVLGYEEAGGKPVLDKPREYEVELIIDSKAEKTVVRPAAYLIPAAYKAAVDTLRRHGVRVDVLREDVEVEAEVYTVRGVTRAMRPFQGHSLVSVAAAAEKRAVRAEAGSYIVRSNQKLGVLAAYLLEPESGDGLTAWNFFDEALKDGGEFPVLRLGTRALVMAELPPLRVKEEPLRPVTFEAVYESDNPPNLNGSPVGGLTWLEDGESYLQVRDGRLMRVEALSGRARPFIDQGKLSAALAKLPTISRRQASDIAGRPLHRMDKARRAIIVEHAGDLYWAALDGSEAVRLTSSPRREELVSASPDGRFVAFVRENDLWVVDVQTQRERALTTGGTDLVRNGKADWVYFEELYNRNWQVYWWSPDSERIAYLQVDSTPVMQWTIVNDAAPSDQAVQNVERAPFPKPGTPNPRVKLLIVTAAGGEPREVDLSEYDPADMLVSGVGWWPPEGEGGGGRGEGGRAYCFVQNRTQTWLDLLSIPQDGGKPTRLLRDSTKAWIEAPTAIKFLEGGGFLLASERSGFNHLYRYSKEGKLEGAVTSGAWEVRGVPLVDEKGGWVYFTGTVDSPIAENLYRVRLGGGEPQRLTQEEGSHRCDLSPKGNFFVDSWSSRSEAPRVVLRDLPEGKVVRRLDINPVPDLERWRLARVDAVKVPMPDGFVLEGTVMRPADFDPAYRYPAWFMTYGGPHAPTVSDSWGGGRTWDQVLASAGFVVFRADPRSASGKGAESAWTAYKQLGVQECRDVEDAAKWLVRNYPYVDPSRIGIAGHSYGGYMTAYALTHSKAFAAGIAGAPVTDWRDYDSIYTERYMLTPAENPEGYDRSSVVKAARELSGRLLLVHGMIDDNVHLQNSTRLVRALQQAGKPFEMMLYPESRHGIGGRHYQRLQYDFITRTLGGPEGPPAAPSPSISPEVGRLGP